MPLNLTHCTLTGVDETVGMDRIADLSKDFPLVEWGFLYSPKRQGQPGRYPPVGLLARNFQVLPAHVRVALHVCGDGVPNLIAGAGNSSERQLLDLVAARGGRVQLNFSQRRKPVDLDALAKVMARYPDTVFITQENAANTGVWEALRDLGAHNHAVLFDGSGGRGLTCTVWPQPAPISCGYAGGLGPDNIQTELLKIAAVADGLDTWIDMEGKLRVTGLDGVDRFDLDACGVCLMVARAYAARCPSASQAGLTA